MVDHIYDLRPPVSPTLFTMPDRATVKTYPVMQFVSRKQPIATLIATVRSTPTRLDISFRVSTAETPPVVGWPRALSLRPDLAERKS